MFTVSIVGRDTSVQVGPSATIKDVLAVLGAPARELSSPYHDFALSDNVLISTLDAIGTGRVALRFHQHRGNTYHECCFDGIVLESVAGKGFFGQVWRGTMPVIGSTQRMVIAAKELKTSSSAKFDQTGIEMLNRELHCLQNLRHPNLVDFYGLAFPVQLKGNPALITGFCDGGTLRTWFRIIWDVRAYWIASLQVCHGLTYLHNLPTPVIHSDLKPDNILMVASQEHAPFPLVKLVDFGLAQALNPNSSVISSRWDIVCIPFTAPEALSSARLYSRESDIWSFGMVLYEMFARRVPYLTEHASHHPVGSSCQYDQLRNDIINGRLPTMDCVISDKAMPLIAQCFRKNRKDRPSAKQMAGLIRGIIQAGTDASSCSSSVNFTAGEFVSDLSDGGYVDITTFATGY